MVSMRDVLTIADGESSFVHCAFISGVFVHRVEELEEVIVASEMPFGWCVARDLMCFHQLLEPF